MDTGAAVVTPREQHDWLSALARPAQRALTAAGFTRLEQLAGRRKSELLELHGIGANAIAVLEKLLAQQDLALESEAEDSA